jgi:hypothetical protein
MHSDYSILLPTVHFGLPLAYDAKRRILEILLSNCNLVDATLCPTIRKPFDVLVEGPLFGKSGGNRTPMELFVAGLRDWDLEIHQELMRAIAWTAAIR